MCATLKIPGLSRWGLSTKDCAVGSDLIQKSQGSSSMKVGAVTCVLQLCCLLVLRVFMDALL
jgi:hypothetical protein